MSKNQILDALRIRFVRGLLAEPFERLVDQSAEALGIHLTRVRRESVQPMGFFEVIAERAGEILGEIGRTDFFHLAAELFRQIPLPVIFALGANGPAGEFLEKLQRPGWKGFLIAAQEKARWQCRTSLRVKSAE